MKWFSIAVHTFLQERRGKLFFNVIIFSAVLFVSSFLFAEVSIGDKAKVIYDIALAGISIICVLTAIIAGSDIVSGDIQHQIIYTVMSKPLRRWEIIVGKSCGLWLLIALNTLVMGACFYLIASFYKLAPPLMFSWALLFIFFEASILGEISILFSLFAHGYLNIAFALVTFVIGHLAAELKLFCYAADSKPLVFISNLIFFVFPDLGALDIKNQIVHGMGMSAAFFAYGLSYSLAYVALITIIACFFFRSREV